MVCAGAPQVQSEKISTVISGGSAKYRKRIYATCRPGLHVPEPPLSNMMFYLRERPDGSKTLEDERGVKVSIYRWAARRYGEAQTQTAH